MVIRMRARQKGHGQPRLSIGLPRRTAEEISRFTVVSHPSGRPLARSFASYARQNGKKF